MIEYIDYKPQCFSHLPKDVLCFEVLEDGRQCAYVGVQFMGYTAHLHIVFSRFNHNILRVVKDVAWPYVKRLCEQNNCRTLVVSKEGSNEEVKTWKGFIKHLGFVNPKRVFLATLELQHGD